MIDLRDVQLSLQSEAGLVDILNGVDLQIPQGTTVGLVGPSGAGKSTLLAVMAGLERPNQGSVRVLEQPLEQMSEDELGIFRRDSVGIVFQSFHLIGTMNALENVAIPLELANKPDAFAVAEAGLRAVGLGHRLQHYPSQLSGGEQQRVALARAMACRPPLILADEPTGNLDAATGEEIVELLFSLQAEHGSTLVLITHDAGLASRCERMITLVDGRIQAAA